MPLEGRDESARSWCDEHRKSLALHEFALGEGHERKVIARAQANLCDRCAYAIWLLPAEVRLGPGDHFSFVPFSESELVQRQRLPVLVAP